MLRTTLALTLVAAHALAGPAQKAPIKLPPKATQPLEERKLEKVEKKGDAKKPEPKAEAKPEVKKPEPKAEAKKPEATPEAKKPEPKAEAKPEAKKPEPKAEAKPEPKAEPPKAPPPPPPPPAPWPVAPKLGLTVERFQLANGLRVLLVPETAVPTVSVVVTYDVGSRDEVKGRTGFAHLFEHMMFQGSENVPRGAFDGYLSARGGTNNGTTNEDRTNYYEVLPSHELPLALWLEADRMRALSVTPENFENQRAVVKEEYRMSVSNTPYALSDVALGEKVYANYPAYAHDAIGSMEDLDAAEFPWVAEFFKRHYGPNRAVLAIAGAIDLAEAKALVEKYFAHIPASAEPAPLHAISAAPPSASRTVMKDPLAKLTRVADAWLMPYFGDDDRYALEIAAAILGDGESSRLERTLVRERGVAVEVEAQVDDRRGPSVFGVSMKLASGVALPRAEAALTHEIERLAAEAPSEAEVRKALARLEAKLLNSMESNLGRGEALSMHELRTGDAGGFERELERFFRVRPADVSRVVKKWLSPKNRVRIVTEPAPQKPSAEVSP